MIRFMRSTCMLAVGAAIVLGGAQEAAAQGRGGGAPMTPLLYRQQIMQQFQANMTALGAIRAGTVGAPSHLLPRAVVLQQLTQTLGEAFPAGSEGGRALPAIWSDQPGLTARIQAVQAAANTLVEAARSGNAEQVAAAQMGVQGACGACHMQFRGPAQ